MILQIPESQEILKAISGNDIRFRPYTSICEEYAKNATFVKHIVEKIESWNKLYGLDIGSKTHNLLHLEVNIFKSHIKKHAHILLLLCVLLG